MNFPYKKSYKIIYWGYCFDSLLELKYALSISDEYDFLHARIPVYYNLKTKMPTAYIRECTRRYTPDFLIRHKVSGKAFWIEIKPEGFNDREQLDLRKQVAENYIQWRKYDWEFKVVFGDAIVLDERQRVVYQNLCRHKSRSGFKMCLRKLNDRFNGTVPPLFSDSPKHVEFVMFGITDRLKQRLKR